MDIRHGLTIRNGTEYTFKLLEAAMNKVLTGTGYTFKGVYNTKNAYTENDVVFYQDKVNNTYDIYYCSNAVAANVGWTTTNWKKYDYKFADKVKVDEKDSELDTLIKTLILALTGSTNYKGAFDSNTQYEAGDVVITLLNGVVTLLKASKASKGIINFDNWEILKLMSEKEMTAYSGGGPYSNVARTYDVYITTQGSGSETRPGWEADTTYPGYKFRYHMYVPYIESGHYFVLTAADDETLDEAIRMNIMPAISVSSAGKMTIYATNRPTKILKFKLIFLNTIDGASTSKIPGFEVTIPRSKWSAAEEDIIFYQSNKPDKTRRGYKAVIDCDEAKENYVPCVIVTQATCDISEKARMYPSVRIEEGKLTFYSELKPEADIICKVVFVNVIGTDTMRKIKTVYEHDLYSFNATNFKATGLGTQRYWKQFYSDDFREAYYGQIIFDPYYLDDVMKIGMHRYATIHDGMLEAYYFNYSADELPGKVVFFNTTDGLVENTNVTIDFDGLNIATNEEVWNAINEILGKN